MGWRIPSFCGPVPHPFSHLKALARHPHIYLDENGQVERTISIGSDRVPLLARFAVGEATEAELQANSSANKGTCGQNGKQAAAEIPGAGPGTELKKILAKVGIGSYG